MSGEDVLQPGLAGVATGEPDDGRGWTESQLEVNEVTILGDDGSSGFRGQMVDGFIVCVPQSHVANWKRSNGELAGQPECETRRELGIEPDDHAARTGWSIMRLA